MALTEPLDKESQADDDLRSATIHLTSQWRVNSRLSITCKEDNLSAPPWGVVHEESGEEYNMEKKVIHDCVPSREYLRGFLEYTPKNHSKLRMKIKSS